MNRFALTLFATLLISLNVFGGRSIVFAQSPTPTLTPRATVKPTTSPTASASATPTPIPEDTVKQNIKDRIERVIENSSSSGTKVVRKKHALVGKVAKVTAEAVVITTLHGVETVRYVPDKTTVLTLPKLTTTKLSDVELNSFVIVMGYVQGEDAMEARRILVSPTPLFPLVKDIFLGTVESITTTSLQLKLRDNTQQTVILGRRTIYKTVDTKIGKRTDIKAGQEVLVIVPKPEPEETATPSATVVRIIK